MVLSLRHALVYARDVIFKRRDSSSLVLIFQYRYLLPWSANQLNFGTISHLNSFLLAFLLNSFYNVDLITHSFLIIFNDQQTILITQPTLVK